MNVKNFLICGIVGGIADYLLGWVLWGMLFKDCFPAHTDMNMTLIFLGCMTFGFFLSYVFTAWSNITTVAAGIKSGMVFAFFIGFFHNCFHYSDNLTPDYKVIATDVALYLICGAVVGVIVSLLNGKIK